MSTEGLDDLFAISDEGVDAVRSKAASLLNADPSHVFFVCSTSHGVGVVAEGLSWRDGDEVVLYELDHPAGVFPWLNLADRGVKSGSSRTAAGSDSTPKTFAGCWRRARASGAGASATSRMVPAGMGRRSLRS